MIESTALPGGISAGMMIGGGDKPASETNQEKMIDELGGIRRNTAGVPPMPKFVSTKGPSLERQLAHITDPAERAKLQKQIDATKRRGRALASPAPPELGGTLAPPAPPEQGSAFSRWFWSPAFGGAPKTEDDTAAKLDTLARLMQEVADNTRVEEAARAR